MADLRITWSAYRPPLIAYREEARRSLPGNPPPPPPDRGEAATASHETPPIIEPRTSPSPFSPQVSPIFAARVYQANIPTQLYTYPFVTRPDKNDVPGATSGAANEQAGTPVTLIPYEPGTLVDCHV